MIDSNKTTEKEQPATEMVVLNSCGLHPGYRAHYDGLRCPACEEAFEVAKMRGGMKFLQNEVERLKKLETENTTLQSRVWELEDRFSEELACGDCVDGEAVCRACAGTGGEGARPDDHGHRFTCRECKGSGRVTCSECPTGAGA